MTEENKKQSLAEILKAAQKQKNNGPRQKNNGGKLNKNSQVIGGATTVRRSGKGG